MTLDEIIRSLPNGLHDAERREYTINYAKRTVHLVLDIWVGRNEKREAYRPATIDLDNLHFWIIEGPDERYPPLNGPVRIDVGAMAELKDTPAIHLPAVPALAFVNWIYADWNAFIYVAAEAAHFQWTGAEEERIYL